MTKLSIITINRNNAAGLRRTIQSVVSQTYTDFEYIIIDGASTDESVAVIKEFEKLKSWEIENPQTKTVSRRLQWVSEPDKGIYNAMNKGILKSKGEYLLFLNSGDWLVDEKVIQTMIDNTDNVDILIGNIYLINGLEISRNEYIGINPNHSKISQLTILDLVFGVFPHNACFFKNELFQKYGLYDEKLKIVSDWKFMIHVIIFNNAKTKILRNTFVTNFDLNGISATETTVYNTERQEVLNSFFPEKLLLDFQSYYSLYINSITIRKRYNDYMKLRNNKFYLFFIKTFLWIQRKTNKT